METEFAPVSMTKTCDRNWCDCDGDVGSPNLISIVDWQSTDFRGQHESSAAPFSARADAVPCEGKQARNWQPRNHHSSCGFTILSDPQERL